VLGVQVERHTLYLQQPKLNTLYVLQTTPITLTDNRAVLGYDKKKKGQCYKLHTYKTHTLSQVMLIITKKSDRQKTACRPEINYPYLTFRNRASYI
jgi:hypothetical protein